jgi:hypothetical protein
MNKDNVYKQRLLALAELLETLPRKRFDYSHWAGDEWKGKTDLSCGTSACALGWATTMPSLRKLGLRLVKDLSGWVAVKLISKNGTFMNETEAAHEVFGVSEQEFQYLFIPGDDDEDEDITLPELGLNTYAPGENATPKQVAKHIRKFVKAKYK